MAATQDDILYGPVIEEPGEEPYRLDRSGRPVRVHRAPAESMSLAVFQAAFFQPTPLTTPIALPSTLQTATSTSLMQKLWPAIKYYGWYYGLPAAAFASGGTLTSLAVTKAFPYAFAFVFPTPSGWVAPLLYSHYSATAFQAAQLYAITSGGSILGGTTAAITWGGSTAIRAIEFTPRIVTTVARPASSALATVASATISAIGDIARSTASAVSHAIIGRFKKGSSTKPPAGLHNDNWLIVHPDSRITEQQTNYTSNKNSSVTQVISPLRETMQALPLPPPDSKQEHPHVEEHIRASH